MARLGWAAVFLIILIIGNGILFTLLYVLMIRCLTNGSPLLPAG